jgi:hypothetical protein
LSKCLAEILNSCVSSEFRIRRSLFLSMKRLYPIDKNFHLDPFE